MKNSKVIFALAILTIMTFSVAAFAAQKTRTNMQTQISNNKLVEYNPAKMYDTLTDLNDSSFNKSTDAITDITGVTATATELNYNDITTLGTGAASKSVVLDSAGDYTFPATATIVMPASGSLTLQASSTFAIATTAAFTGAITGDGGDSLFGFKQDQVATTTASVTLAQCGKSFVSDSTDVMTLPEASTVLGCRYTFIGGTADDLDINPADGTDQIGLVVAVAATITPSAGDAIRITDIGAAVTLEAVGANLWAVIAFNGAVTDVN